MDKLADLDLAKLATGARKLEAVLRVVHDSVSFFAQRIEALAAEERP